MRRPVFDFARFETTSTNTRDFISENKRRSPRCRVAISQYTYARMTKYRATRSVVAIDLFNRWVSLIAPAPQRSSRLTIARYVTMCFDHVNEHGSGAPGAFAAKRVVANRWISGRRVSPARQIRAMCVQRRLPRLMVACRDEPRAGQRISASSPADCHHHPRPVPARAGLALIRRTRNARTVRRAHIGFA